MTAQGPKDTRHLDCESCRMMPDPAGLDATEGFGLVLRAPRTMKGPTQREIQLDPDFKRIFLLSGQWIAREEGM